MAELESNRVPVYCSCTGMVDPLKLVPNPRNPNKHPESQIELLAKIIKNQGWRAPITVSKRSGFIVRGHGRLAAALKLKLTEVPVDMQEYANEAEEWADVVADNRIAELAEIDDQLLREMMKEIETAAAGLEGFDMDLTGFDAAELEKLMAGEGGPGQVKDDDFDAEKVAASITEPVSKPGDIWQLGRHRLMCGDSTKAECVTKLLAGAVPFIMVTDPPYGVEYDPDWRNHAERKDGTKLGASSLGKVENDDNADWSETYKLFPGSVVYVWHAGKFAGKVAANLENVGFNIRTQIIWRKKNFVISRGHYHWQHEPCWYAVRNNQVSKWCGDRTQSTIWDIDNNSLGHGKKEEVTIHGTQKPIECMARPIRNHGDKNDSVYDPFLGSGTTLMASEQLGRICYGLEINPVYCDVIIKRWEGLTGQKAELLKQE